MGKTRPENEFPTILDLKHRLDHLVEIGLGAHPVQIVIVPASTMKAIALVLGGKPMTGRPAVMIELPGSDVTKRLPVSFVSTDYLDSSKIKPSAGH